MWAKVIEINPNDYDALTSLADAYDVKGLIDMAIHTWEKISEVYPN